MIRGLALRAISLKEIFICNCGLDSILPRSSAADHMQISFRELAAKFRIFLNAHDKREAKRSEN